MDRHQVIRFAPGLWKAFRQEIIEGAEVFEPPVLAGSHFAQILAQFDESRVLLLLGMALPGQDLIHLVENEQSAAPIQFGFHQHCPLVVKLVKPIKIRCSRAANEFRIHQLLISQTEA